MSATSSAYSSRSWPSSTKSRRSRAITVLRAAVGCMLLLLETRGPAAPHRRSASVDLRDRLTTMKLRGRTRGLELVGDRLEDRRDAGAGRGDGRDRHERDQRDEQRVLEQVLAFIVA